MSTTEGLQPESTHAGTEEGAAPQSAAGESTADTVKISGKEYSVDEVLEWRNSGLRQADYSQKTMAIADERREYERQIRERDERIAELKEQGATPREAKITEATEKFQQMSEYVPGLGEFAETVIGAINDISTRQSKAEAEADRYLKEDSHEEAMGEALASFKDKPFANLKQMRYFMDARGLGPKDADIAYESLYAFQLGEAAKEADMMKRGANAPSTMGGSRVGLQGSSAEEVVGTRTGKSIRDTSFQELRDRALADPRRPKGDFE